MCRGNKDFATCPLSILSYCAYPIPLLSDLPAYHSGHTNAFVIHAAAEIALDTYHMHTVNRLDAFLDA